jgi:hypothetical protein
VLRPLSCTRKFGDSPREVATVPRLCTQGPAVAGNGKQERSETEPRLELLGLDEDPSQLVIVDASVWVEDCCRRRQKER